MPIHLLPIDGHNVENAPVYRPRRAGTWATGAGQSVETVTNVPGEVTSRDRENTDGSRVASCHVEGPAARTMVSQSWEARESSANARIDES